jgi:glycerol-3-phosphate dehydrogenase
VGLVQSGGRVEGVCARDLQSGRDLEFRAHTVINAAGPWSRSLSAAFGCERAGLFEPSLAWNVLFDRPAISDHALAARERVRGAHTYFLVPWKGALLVGTGHAPWHGDLSDPHLDDQGLQAFVEGLNAAVPSLELRPDEALRVFSGLLPVRRAGTADLASREVVVDHGRSGGPKGLFSVSGVKLTMAAHVAGAVLRRAFPDRARRDESALPALLYPEAIPEDYPVFWEPSEGDTSWLDPLRRAIEQESVCHLDDLLLRRSSLGDHPGRALRLAPEVCRLSGWDAARSREEQARLAQALRVRLPEPPREASEAGAGAVC